MQFEYYYVSAAVGTLDIEDIGNFALSGVNDLYQEYFLIVKTELGRTKVIQYGPLIVDSDVPCESISYTYDEFEFKEAKISKIIEKFLNGKSMISQALIIDVEEAKSRIKDLVEFL